MASLGTRIGEYRRRKQITQDQMAERFNVTAQAVSKWENDISCPDISLLPQMADFFGISVDELLRGEAYGSRMQYAPAENGDISRRILKIRVNENGGQGDVVNINLPLALIQAALKMGIPLIQSDKSMSKLGVQSISLDNIDFGEIFRMAELGAMGKLVEVKSAAGDLVEIYVE